MRAAALVAAFVVTGGSPIHARTAAFGRVHAELTWRGSTLGAPHPYHNIRLAISRDGKLIGDYRPRPAGALNDWGPALGFDGGPLHVVDLDRDGEPEVLVDLYSGGAHCCEESVVYRYARGAYETTKKNWFSPGYSLRDVDGDGRDEFVGADHSFEYVFTAYAGSVDPIRIWHYDRGAFANVTRLFPGAIRAHARRVYHWYGQTVRGPAPRDVRGILAAYAGDMCLLRRCGRGFALVEQAYRAGLLTRRTLGASPGPAGRRYVAALRSFLRRHGYLT
jgi:hypothetical protein